MKNTLIYVFNFLAFVVRFCFVLLGAGSLAILLSWPSVDLLSTWQLASIALLALATYALASVVEMMTEHCLKDRNGGQS